MERTAQWNAELAEKRARREAADKRQAEDRRKAAAYDRLVRALELVESGKVLPLATDEIRRVLEGR